MNAVLEKPKTNFKNTSPLMPLIASSTLVLTLTNPFIANESLPTCIENAPSELINSFFKLEQQEITLQKLNYIIRSYGAYEINWDGYGGIPAKEETIRDTISFLRLLPGDAALPFSGLSGDGEINLFWDKDGVFIDVGFIGNNKFSYYARDKNNNELSEDEVLISSGFPLNLINLIKKI